MAPSLHELGVVPGEKVRVKKDILPEGNNPREVFSVVEAPAFPHFGPVVLRGALSGTEINTNSNADVLTQKVK
jgi:hypothetical protein